MMNNNGGGTSGGSYSYEPVVTTGDAAANDAPLVPQPPEQLEVLEAQPMMQVKAPANLPEGYEFNVSVGQGQSMTVQVPKGGVEEGQTFEIAMPNTTNTTNNSTDTTISIPVGHWRDETWQLFNYGICHPHCWTSVACSLLAAGQVIRRLQFNWRGKPSNNVGESARAFEIILIITIFHWFMFAILYIAELFLDPNDYLNDEPEDGWIEPTGTLLVVLITFDIFKWVYICINVWLLFSVRVSVRKKYGIPGDESEDCLCSLFCPCLVAGQLLRHTTDYDRIPSQLCTDTGLPKHAPRIV